MKQLAVMERPKLSWLALYAEPPKPTALAVREAGKGLALVGVVVAGAALFVAVAPLIVLASSGDPVLVAVVGKDHQWIEVDRWDD